LASHSVCLFAPLNEHEWPGRHGVTMTLMQKAYQFALKEKNKDWKEYPGSASNPNITKAYACVDGLGNPITLDDSKVSWCSVLMNYMIQSVGGKGTRSAIARSWLSWGKECKPFQGCIVVFKRGNSGWEGHVAFYIKEDKDFVWCMGGNQSNDFNISKYRKDAVLGYRTSLDT